MTELRILACEGPGDAIASFRAWSDGGTFAGVTHVPFSAQLFEAARALGAKLHVLATHGRLGSLTRGDITVEHTGNPYENRRGAAFHLTHAQHAAQIVARAAAIRANVVLIGTEPYASLLAPLWALPNVHVVPTLHCVFWPQFQPRSRSNRLLRTRDGLFYRRGASAVVAISRAIAAQVEELAGGPGVPVIDFVPSYRREFVGSIAAPEKVGDPFVVLFAGRVEEEKGALDLVTIAKALRDRGEDFVFEVAGSGSASGRLEQAVREAGLEERFKLLGWCDQPAMRAALSRSHAVIVPTRTSFVEGFNMVVVEALLAGRPVVTSPVCPAVEYVADAIVEARPDDVESYVRGLSRLANDRALYDEKRARAEAVSAIFLDPAHGYQAALTHVFSAIRERRPILPRRIALPAIASAAAQVAPSA